MNEQTLLTIAIILFSVVIAGVVLWAGLRQRRRLEALLRQVSTHFGGIVPPTSWLRYPRMFMEIQGSKTELEYYSTGGKHPTLYTRIFFDVSACRPFALSIYPESFTSQLGKWLGMQDIQISDPHFDPRYIIKSASPLQIRNFLHPQTRQLIDNLRSLGKDDHIEISLDKDRLQIKKLNWIEDINDLQKFIQLSSEIYQEYRKSC